MQIDIEELALQFQRDTLDIQSLADVEAIRIKYLGRKNGLLTPILRSLKTLPDDQKKTVGLRANEVRGMIEQMLQSKERALRQQASGSDLTLPGITQPRGHLHPMTHVMNEVIDVFRSLGFMVYEGPELESDFYNFEALNIPQSHPARDIQDTFFVKTPIEREGKRDSTQDSWVMRTHTSPMQVRIMEQFKPPIRCIIPGRVFRNEATDATHEHTFYQLEGFVVDTHVSIGQLIWTLREVFRQYYKQDVTLRLRPGYFPFTEPSYEPDMSCTFCQQQDPQCRVCKGTGWIEMGGSGMIHPNVFKAAGYPDGAYSGFAFGMGLNRLAMQKYGISDIRQFMENDIRLLAQL